MVLWIFLATLAAIGNAGVLMGCYFLSSAFLVAMNVPLYIMGLITHLRSNGHDRNRIKRVVRHQHHYNH